jgi:hypothetical protein
LSLVPVLKYRLTKLSPSFLITLYTIFQNLPLRDKGTHIRNMNVYIMYVEISAVYCKNHADKQVECEGKVMNILMLKQVVYIELPSGFRELRRKQQAFGCVLCKLRRRSKFTA